jgi:penicillin-binding protein 2
VDKSKIRLFIIQVLALSLMVTLAGRLWYIQGLVGDRYRVAAGNNGTRPVLTSAVRGLILDDRGRPLVTNRARLAVSVDRTILGRQPNRGAAVLTRLAGLLKVTPQEVRDRVALCGEPAAVPGKCWSGPPVQPVQLSFPVSTATALAIVERRSTLPGVTADPIAIRDYPGGSGEVAPHLLGSLGPVTAAEVAEQRQVGVARRAGPLRPTDVIGRDGLERSYDAYLRGTPGVRELAVNSQGNVTGTVRQTPPIPGDYLVTSIDARLQEVTETQLTAAIARARSTRDNDTGKLYRGDSGAAVVMDVRTGRVLSMASYPSYDPSWWQQRLTTAEFTDQLGEKANSPLISRATQGEFAPASTFKLISTAAVLDNGDAVPDGIYNCPSAVSIQDRSFTNYESQAYGPISLRRALQVSCDTVFYQFAYREWLADGGIRPVDKPVDPMITMAKGFGLGKPTGIDLPGEAPGRITDRAFKKSYHERTKDFYCHYVERSQPDQRTPYLLQLARENCVDGAVYRAGDAVNFAVGQGDTVVTPLQLTRAYAAVANGGTLWVPRIGRAVLSPSGTVVASFPPKSAGRLPASAKTLAFLRSTLATVTTSGTAAPPFVGFPLDQIPVAAKTGTGEVFGGKQTTSWFATFAPADKPKYAVVMMVSQGGTGSGTSAPSVRKIYEALFGVVGTTVDPARSVLANGEPAASLPQIASDGTIAVPKDPPARRPR